MLWVVWVSGGSGVERKAIFVAPAVAGLPGGASRQACRTGADWESGVLGDEVDALVFGTGTISHGGHHVQGHAHVQRSVWMGFCVCG